jgi:hypothetical protein
MRLRELIKAWVEAFNARDSEEGFARAEMACIPKTSLKMVNGAFSSGATHWGCEGAASFTLLTGRLFFREATGTS